jgi:hypothetical protein
MGQRIPEDTVLIRSRSPTELFEEGVKGFSVDIGVLRPGSLGSKRETLWDNSTALYSLLPCLFADRLPETVRRLWGEKDEAALAEHSDAPVSAGEVHIEVPVVGGVVFALTNIRPPIGVWRSEGFPKQGGGAGVTHLLLGGEHPTLPVEGAQAPFFGAT